MVGCGENWCVNPWDWMITHILLRLAILGAEGVAGNDVDGATWG